MQKQSINLHKQNNNGICGIDSNLCPQLHQYIKLNLSETELVHNLRRYLIDPTFLRFYGYPVESVIFKGCVEIYKCPPRFSAGYANYLASNSCLINTDSRLLHPASWQETQRISSRNLTDAGQSSSASHSNASHDEGTTLLMRLTAIYKYQIFIQNEQPLKRNCVRCMLAFHVTESGVYLSSDICSYHWGKLYELYTNKGYIARYNCCSGNKNSEGCTRNPLHVWTGTVVGINGPYIDFVHTRPCRHAEHDSSKIYAIDCEMAYTGLGLEVVKVTLINHDGHLVYDHFVRPQAEIVDYNTRFSGVRANDLCKENKYVKTLSEVQDDLLQLIDADTILIGHGLENDLRVLRIVHKTVIDTSIIFSHTLGFPYRRSLRHMARALLKRNIQSGYKGHNSFEDTRTCLELVLWKLGRDMQLARCRS